MQLRTIKKKMPVIGKINSKKDPEHDRDGFIKLCAARGYTKYVFLPQIMENPKLFEKLNRFAIESPDMRAMLNDNEYEFDGESFLHYACRYNKYNFISTLIGLKCKITEINFNRCTPLHVALQLNNEKCINEFIKLVKNPNKYPHVAEELIQLLSIYNNQSYTITHLAVLNNYTDFVRVLLEFGRAQQVDLCKINVLTNGDNILHLATKQKLYNMKALIEEYLPNERHYRNYEGLSSYDLEQKSKSVSKRAEKMAVI